VLCFRTTHLPQLLTCTCNSGQSAYYTRPSPSITSPEESTRAPTRQYMDVGTPPHYPPALNHSNVVFRSRSDADPTSPSRGISIPSFSREGLSDLMEAADDTPLALTPAGEEDSITVEFHVRIVCSLGASRLTSTTVAWLHAFCCPNHHGIPQNIERALRAPAHLAPLSWSNYCGACNPFRQDGSGRLSRTSSDAEVH
jgi:hypothetical protein